MGWTGVAGRVGTSAFRARGLASGAPGAVRFGLWPSGESGAATRALALVCFLVAGVPPAAAHELAASPQAAQAGPPSGGEPAGEATPAAGQDAPAPQERELDAIVADILSGPASDVDGAPATEECIARLRIDRTQVLNERFVVFHMRGAKKYLVQFRHRCPGLRRRGAIELESRSFQVCAMDSIRGHYGVGITGMWGPRCLIPGFQPVTEAQIEFIEEALQDGGPT